MCIRDSQRRGASVLLSRRVPTFTRSAQLEASKPAPQVVNNPRRKLISQLMFKIMANETYKVGDLVQLKSGGPAMTVYEVSRSGLHVKCQWFDGAKLEEGDFAMI